MPNQSQSLDIISVINLGHKAKQPLITLVSELGDGLEPHDTIPTAVAGPAYPVSDSRSREGVPGYGWVGAWEGYTGHPPSLPD